MRIALTEMHFPTEEVKMGPSRKSNP